MSGRLEGRRVLVTDAERYIGPPVVELFRREGAEVTADQSEYGEPGVVRDVVERAGRIDVLVANFAGPASITELQRAQNQILRAIVPLDKQWIQPEDERWKLPNHLRNLKVAVL